MCCAFFFARQIHKEIGSTVIRRFVNQELAKTGKLSSQGVAFLANIQSRLTMKQDVRYDVMYLVVHGMEFFGVGRTCESPRERT